MVDIELVKLFIRTSFSRIKTIDDIAKVFHVSQETLRKDFVRQQGVRLSVYVSNTRVEEMKQLLTATTQPCNKICLGVGFSREEVGERAFKRKVGMTMSEFRKEIESRPQPVHLEASGLPGEQEK